MLENFKREKLINAILFFAEKTEKCGKTKLFKLLFMLDFEHYKAIGRSVTGLEYRAWPRGPLPLELDKEMDHVQPDMAERVRFESKPDNTFVKVRALRYFDKNVFSRRELEIMNNLARDFETADWHKMVMATHLPDEPWDRVYNQEGRKQGVIPYDYAVSEKDKELIEYLSRENDIFKLDLEK